MNKKSAEDLNQKVAHKFLALLRQANKMLGSSFSASLNEMIPNDPIVTENHYSYIVVSIIMSEA